MLEKKNIINCYLYKDELFLVLVFSDILNKIKFLSKMQKSDELDLEDFPNVLKEQESEKSSFENANSSSSVSR